MDEIVEEITELPYPIEEISFGKELAKTFALSTAMTVGVFGGMALVGYAVVIFKDRRAARKNQNTETESTD